MQNWCRISYNGSRLRTGGEEASKKRFSPGAKFAGDMLLYEYESGVVPVFICDGCDVLSCSVVVLTRGVLCRR